MLYVLIGTSGSGKSTFAEKLVDERTVCVSTDTIRKNLLGDEACQDQGYKVFTLAYGAVRNWLRNGLDVIFDATNTTHRSRKQLVKEVKSIPCRKVAVLFNVSPAQAKAQNAGRSRVVPEEVIDRQYAQLMADASKIPDLFDAIVVVGG